MGDYLVGNKTQVCIPCAINFCISLNIEAVKRVDLDFMFCKKKFCLSCTQSTAAHVLQIFQENSHFYSFGYLKYTAFGI